MLILVCGMHRSGSTLVWQITRALLSDRPGVRYPRHTTIDDFRAAAADPDGILMAKVHFRPAYRDVPFPQDGALYLYTFRDVRDAVASLFRKGRFPVGSEQRGPAQARVIARREMAGDTMWTSMTNVWIAKYEDFHQDIPMLIRSLAAVLGVTVDDARVAEIAADVDLEAQRARVRAALESGIDEGDRITSNHITDGRSGAWRDTLTPEETAAVESESAPWLARHGYDVESTNGRAILQRAKRRRQREIAAERAAAEQRRADAAAAVAARAEMLRRRRQRAFVWAVLLLLLGATAGVVNLLLGDHLGWRVGSLAVLAAALGVGIRLRRILRLQP
jgi:hypothetical protein